MNTCTHGIDTPRDAKGRCKACRAGEYRASKARRAAGITLRKGVPEPQPPQGWTCPTCKSASSNWFCSPACKVGFSSVDFWRIETALEVVI